MTEELFNEVTKWQKETFPTATALSRVHHLKEEILELIKELDIPHPSYSQLQQEYADCFLLLFGSASASGMNYSDICCAIEMKMKINKSRRWGKPDENGVIKHIVDNENY